MTNQERVDVGQARMHEREYGPLIAYCKNGENLVGSIPLRTLFKAIDVARREALKDRDQLLRAAKDVIAGAGYMLAEDGFVSVSIERARALSEAINALQVKP